jgi:hypothetical protein
LSFLFNIGIIELSLLFFFSIHNYAFGSLFLFDKLFPKGWNKTAHN